MHQNSCALAEAAELYALNRLAERTIPFFEEHLLVCAHCRRVVDFADEFSETLKAAHADLRQAA